MIKTTMLAELIEIRGSRLQCVIGRAPDIAQSNISNGRISRVLLSEAAPLNIYESQVCCRLNPLSWIHNGMTSSSMVINAVFYQVPYSRDIYPGVINSDVKFILSVRFGFHTHK
jgi:hypothetical protein